MAQAAWSLADVGSLFSHLRGGGGGGGAAGGALPAGSGALQAVGAHGSGASAAFVGACVARLGRLYEASGRGEAFGLLGAAEQRRMLLLCWDAAQADPACPNGGALPAGVVLLLAARGAKAAQTPSQPRPRDTPAPNPNPTPAAPGRAGGSGRLSLKIRPASDATAEIVRALGHNPLLSVSVPPATARKPLAWIARHLDKKWGLCSAGHARPALLLEAGLGSYWVEGAAAAGAAGEAATLSGLAQSPRDDVHMLYSCAEQDDAAEILALAQLDGGGGGADAGAAAAAVAAAAVPSDLLLRSPCRSAQPRSGSGSGSGSGAGSVDSLPELDPAWATEQARPMLAQSLLLLEGSRDNFGLSSFGHSKDATLAAEGESAASEGGSQAKRRRVTATSPPRAFQFASNPVPIGDRASIMASPLLRDNIPEHSVTVPWRTESEIPHQTSSAGSSFDCSNFLNPELSL